MKSEKTNAAKELYKQLRVLTCDQLWNDEVPQFDRASPQERIERVGLVRAVGVVFSESGTGAQRDAVRPWLSALLNDPQEKIRRYAMAALPKIGAGAGEETELLSLLKTTTVDREKKFVGKALDKIGGAATLEEIGKGSLLPQTEQKVKASVARNQASIIRMDRALSHFAGLQIHLRGRSGLEEIVRDEVEQSARVRAKFRIDEVVPGLVALTPTAPFSLGDIYTLRCFGTVGFVLGAVDGPHHENSEKSIEKMAAIIASELSRRVFKTFTEGPIRYRLDFVEKGHQRGAVRLFANRAYALCPEILNDSRSAPWTISIHPNRKGNWVELIPRLSPDPRFAYRREDVPAASHPPLAASMAWLAGNHENEIVWDPFCGSGLELIERALLGGVRMAYGTDRSAEAITITGENFATANRNPVPSRFICCDFRDFPRIEGLRENSLTLIITNPPMGKRVPIPNLRGLIEDLFSIAAKMLKPGGRLIFANPFRIQSPDPSLKLQSRRVVDFGGFNCALELYLKSGR